MVTLNKIYTRTGDDGRTRLASGAPVSKSDARVEAYGAVDELNAVIGVARLNSGQNDRIDAMLGRIQNELFDVGGELATPKESLDTLRQQVVTHESVSLLEKEIDEYNDLLEPLANFILPGGHQANAMAHVVRTVCRRAERAVVALASEDSVREEVSIYLNRLSDWFFVVSRVISQDAGVPEILWHQKGKNVPKV